MANLEEIKETLKQINALNDYPTVLMLTTSEYPTVPMNVNLLKLKTLANEFPNIILGYSDHTQGSLASSLAVALGAKVFEKHFTLDNKKIGLDNHMATEPNDMKILTSECLVAFNSLGKEKRLLSKQEFDQRKKMRRSIFTRQSLKRNEKITLEKILLRRPGEGIPPNKVAAILGKKVKRNIKSK